VPADKSISHRAALFAAMCCEPVTIRNYLDAADTRSTLDALRALGAGVEQRGGTVVVDGVGLAPRALADGATIDVGNAGTLLRLLPGWLAGQVGGRWTLDGDESIRKRPVDRIAEPLRLMGADLSARENRLPPLTVSGAPLRGIDYRVPVASAQVKSCVLIAGLLAEGETTVSEPHSSRDHSERMLERAGVPLSRADLVVSVSRVGEVALETITVPGDPSSAAFFVAAACLVPGSRVTLRDVGLNWTRSGFFRIARRMGAEITGELEAPGTFARQEPVGDLDVSHAPLAATTVDAVEVPLAIDELPLVALLACFAEGETTVWGADELRFKESDRIAGVVDGLRALGATIEATADGFVVQGGTGLDGGVLEAHGDHRLAMMGAVAGLGSRRGVEVIGMDAAAVSYPAFERDLAALVGR